MMNKIGVSTSFRIRIMVDGLKNRIFSTLLRDSCVHAWREIPPFLSLTSMSLDRVIQHAPKYIGRKHSQRSSTGEIEFKPPAIPIRSTSVGKPPVMGNRSTSGPSTTRWPHYVVQGRGTIKAPVCLWCCRKPEPLFHEATDSRLGG